VVEQHRYFEAIAISEEDLKRTGYYRANAQRRETASNAGDINEFLRSLEMSGWVGPVGDVELDRTVQLIGKSNQFNLTTRRYSTGDIETMRKDTGWVTRVVKLADRFGDNGLISVALAHEEGEDLRIDTWLMSCRVLKRNVEAYLLNDLVAAALARGLKRVTGEYIPTAKNALVRNHYASLGFKQTHAGADGRTLWELPIGNDWSPLPHHIGAQ
jgi:FkbH-like protein